MGGFDSHALPPLRAIALLLLLATPPRLAAQQRDSTTRIPAARLARTDSLQPPLTPRRAFFYSFLVPGYGQSILGRHKAAVAFLVVEGMALAMIRESGAEVREARRIASIDTMVVSWVNQSTGAFQSTPDTVPRLFTDNEVHSRRAHIEDWVALLVANHLFAGADAYVASNLWDVRARLALKPVPGGVGVAATIEW